LKNLGASKFFEKIKKGIKKRKIYSKISIIIRNEAIEVVHRV